MRVRSSLAHARCFFVAGRTEFVSLRWGLGEPEQSFGGRFLGGKGLCWSPTARLLFPKTGGQTGTHATPPRDAFPLLIRATSTARSAEQHKKQATDPRTLQLLWPSLSAASCSGTRQKTTTATAAGRRRTTEPHAVAAAAITEEEALCARRPATTNNAPPAAGATTASAAEQHAAGRSGGRPLTTSPRRRPNRSVAANRFPGVTPAASPPSPPPPPRSCSQRMA